MRTTEFCFVSLVEIPSEVVSAGLSMMHSGCLRYPYLFPFGVPIAAFDVPACRRQAPYPRQRLHGPDAYTYSLYYYSNSMTVLTAR